MNHSNLSTKFTIPSGAHGSRFSRLLVVCAAATLFFAGCDKDDEIRTYNSPKEQTAAPSPAMSSASAAHAEDEENVIWDLPEGWVEEGSDGNMRFATLTDPRPAPPVVVSVTKLPPRAVDLLANVNRWRGQLGLADIQAAELDQSARPLKDGQSQGILVDLLGPAPESGEAHRMLATIFDSGKWVWFFKATGPASTISAGEAELMKLYRSVRSHDHSSHQAPQASVPQASAPVIVSQPSDQPLRYTVPDGWREDSTPRQARLMTLLIDGDDSGTELAVTRFPGDVGGELANVNRWRGQLGLPPVSSTDTEDVTDVEIDGFAGKVFRFNSEPGGDQQSGILVALIEHDGHIWFFKMVGPARVLDEQRGRFMAFVSSIRFQ